MRFTAGLVIGAIIGAKFSVTVLFYTNLAMDWAMQYLQGIPTPPTT